MLGITDSDEKRKLVTSGKIGYSNSMETIEEPIIYPSSSESVVSETKIIHSHSNDHNKFHHGLLDCQS